jgi:tripartite-type tricarboxylate transporter receptor subunit TctC
MITFNSTQTITKEEEMIYEFRVYDAVPGKLSALNDRFAKITLDYFWSCVSRARSCVRPPTRRCNNNAFLKMIIIALLTTILFALPTAAFAQPYPSKPVRVIVPWPPGGSNDISARIVLKEVSQSLGQQFVIDNRPGGGGTIGTNIVARAPADGYTLLVNSTTHLANAHLNKSLLYDTLKDFTAVSILVSQPQVLVVHPSLPAKSVKEFIELAKRKPDSILYASSSSGSQAHLSMELFAAMAGIKVVHVPYKGGAPQVIGLLQGEVQASIATVATVIPHIQSGKLRALGVNSPERIRMLPQVPTIDQAGVPGFELNAWIGVLAPANTPRTIIETLHREITKALKTPSVVQSLSVQVLDPWFSSIDEFNDRLRTDYEKYGRLVKISNAKVE